MSERAMARMHRVETVPADHAIPGIASEPLVSSRPYGWNGIVVELYRIHHVDVIAQSSEHIVSLLLRGPINLLQHRNGAVSQRTMHAGDVIITPIGEPKQWRHEEEAEILMLRLAPALVEGIVEHAISGRSSEVKLLDNFGTRDARIEHLALRLLAECKAAGFASRIYVESLVNELVVHLLRHYSTLRSSATVFTGKLPRHKLRRVTDYIDDNLGGDLTVQRIAAILSMSPGHFAHTFAHTTGLTPHRYVIERRVERAKTLLLETELAIAAIAQQAGFSTPSHFSDAFHRITSLTPGQYRRQT